MLFTKGGFDMNSTATEWIIPLTLNDRALARQAALYRRTLAVERRIGNPADHRFNEHELGAFGEAAVRKALGLPLKFAEPGEVDIEYRGLKIEVRTRRTRNASVGVTSRDPSDGWLVACVASPDSRTSPVIVCGCRLISFAIADAAGQGGFIHPADLGPMWMLWGAVVAARGIA